jgi:adenylate cyclase
MPPEDASPKAMTSAGQEMVGAVVFADITGSTGLFERLGDSAAHALIARVLQGLEELTTQFGGRTIKKIGDEILSRFPDAAGAVAYAIAGQRQVNATLAAGSPVRMTYGVNFGPVVEDATGDLFGDTVNIAARLRELASPGQIITTTDTLAAMPAIIPVEKRSLGAHVLEGKNREVEVVEVHWEEELGNLTRAPSGPMPTFKRSSLVLRLAYDGKSIEMRPQDSDQITIGREVGNAIVVPNDAVSRRHATVLARDGKFYLKDHSTNGTHVRTRRETPVVARRETVMLQGKGEISPGVEIEAAGDDLIQYEVARITI